MSHREEASGKTQDTLEKLCLSAGLGTPRGPPGRAGGSVWVTHLDEEDEGDEEEPTAELKRTVDEPEDKKEEYDEDDDDEGKATVDVIKPGKCPNPRKRHRRLSRPVRENYSVSLHALCKGQRVRHQDCREKRFVILLSTQNSRSWCGSKNQEDPENSCDAQSWPLQTCTRLLPISTRLVRCPADLSLVFPFKMSNELFICPLVHHIVTDNPYPPPTMSAPSAPVLTAHPVQPGAPPLQPFYQQQPPPMHPLYAQYQPYQPPPQPAMQPQPEPTPPAEPVQPEATKQESPAEPEVQSPAAEDQPALAPVQDEKKPETVEEEVKAASIQKAAKKKPKDADSEKEPAAGKEKTKKEPVAKEKTKTAAAAKKGKTSSEPAAARQKRKSASEKTEASPAKSKAKSSTAKKGKNPDPEPQLLRVRTRLEAVKRANVTAQAKEEKLARSEPGDPSERCNRAVSPLAGKAEKAEKKSAKETQDESKTEDNTTEKKKPGQRYFQCVYVPGKNAQYPLRPFTPAMSPVMMSPALRSMLEQQRAARPSGQ
ncbi:hypothetical protein L3Q82_011330 [Scortum barcoo]|uniref:Uncharacterized protein n=1 Tax=Scortum barcoo TaxID=214431 RepID=A0ACB8W9H9_9TELE|nr:hypothetical protein L3Q82_011330 [Scortum barcoo]